MNLTSVMFWATGSTLYVESFLLSFATSNRSTLTHRSSRPVLKLLLSFTHARTHVACRAVPYKWYTFRSQIVPDNFERIVHPSTVG